MEKSIVAIWHHHPFFKYAIGTLLVLLIILVFSQIAGFLKPVVDFISIVFTPIAIALLFYYLFRPIVYFFEKYKISRTLTILIIYLLLGIGIVFFVAYLGPILAKQIASLANTSVEAIGKIKEGSRSILFRFFNVNLDYEIEQRVFEIAQQITTVISQNLLDFLGFFTRLAAILAVIPFILFYLLKDDNDFEATVLRKVPKDYFIEIRNMFRNADMTLSNYITGLAIVSLSVGLFLFGGYLIIGLDYALVLSIIAIVFMTIPFLGPFLAAAPAILVGLTESPQMALKVSIVFLIVQQTEANLISPLILGQRLNIHPLTIILLLLAAGSLYGLAGLILVTPFYALAKGLVKNIYTIARLHYSEAKSVS